MFDVELFMEQMEENTNFGLIYPYHIRYEDLEGVLFFNKNYPDSYHSHTFAQVLNVVFSEPRAFYLTEEDESYYSSQELEFIKKVQKREQEKLDNGYKLISLDLTDETVNYLNMLKSDLDLSFEDTIEYILKKLVENDGQILKDMLKNEDREN